MHRWIWFYHIFGGFNERNGRRCVWYWKSGWIALKIKIHHICFQYWCVWWGDGPSRKAQSVVFHREGRVSRCRRTGWIICKISNFLHLLIHFSTERLSLFFICNLGGFGEEVACGIAISLQLVGVVENYFPLFFRYVDFYKYWMTPHCAPSQLLSINSANFHWNNPIWIVLPSSPDISLKF